jgi:NAD(P)-dependent dehydrogenase (short-subunit alcohol dehydrogenase family)
MEIKDQVAVVTGAASGIGRTVALELARRGVKAIAMVDRSPAVGEAAEAVRRQYGTIAEPFVGDVCDDTFRQQVYQQVTAQHGAARICVPAAGITRDGLAVKLDKTQGRARLYPAADFRQVLEINLVAPVYWALEMVGRIAEDRFARGQGPWGPSEEIQGTVIFVGSVSSQGNRGQIAYAATKKGLEGVAATLMKEAIYFGVRCGVVHPGFTDTPLVRALGEKRISEEVLPHTQLRRLIRPDEIADAICFMIGNSAVSGELWVDAGWHPSA